MDETPPLCDILSNEWGWDNVRRDAFQLVAWGYELTIDRVRQHHVEEDITGIIRNGINQKLDEELPPRFQVYSAHNEDPVDDDQNKHGKKRPRVDILIECGGTRPRKRYRLEAKRCAKNSYSIGWYAGGVKDYVDLLYSRFDPEAGLLALIQSDDAPHWKSELGSKLLTDKTLALTMPLKDVFLVQELSHMAVSKHMRTDGSEVSLYHAFLDCKPEE